MKLPPQLPAHLSLTAATLQAASAALKQEFAGWEAPIDALVQQVGPWFTLGIAQQPTVLSVWGLPGHSKYQLVTRLVQLMGLQPVQLPLAEVTTTSVPASSPAQPPVLILQQESTNPAQEHPQAQAWLTQLLAGQGPASLQGALVFLVGSVEDVYPLGRDENPDEDPDLYRALSIAISTQELRRVLGHQWDPALVMRLGQTILLPMLGRQQLVTHLKHCLAQLAQQAQDNFGLSMVWEDSLVERLLLEVTLPRLGHDAVQAALQRTVVPAYWQTMQTLAAHHAAATQVSWGFANNNQLLTCTHASGKPTQYHYPLPLPSVQQPKPTAGDKRAITAVHEAGHAVVAALLQHNVPVMVYSHTPAAELAGYCVYDSAHHIKSEVWLRARLMVLMGGHLAEELAFGTRYVSQGNESDIAKATELAHRMVKEYGMGSQFAKVGLPLPGNEYTFHDDERLAQEAAQLMQLAWLEARACVQANQLLLLQLARYLTQHSYIHQSKLQEFITQYGQAEWPGRQTYPPAAGHYEQALAAALQAAKSEGGTAVLTGFSPPLSPSVYVPLRLTEALEPIPKNEEANPTTAG